MENNKADQNAEKKYNNTSDILGALFKEYDLIQKKVDQNIETMKHMITRILLAVLSIYVFCFQYYSSRKLSIFVDFLMIDALPFLFFFIGIDSIIKEEKQLYYGQYLITIEKKINHILKSYNNYNYNAMDWESWRINYGFADNRLLMWDTILLMVGMFFAVVLTAIIRIYYELRSQLNNKLLLLVIILSLFFTFFVALLVATIKKRKSIVDKNKELINSESIDY